LLNSTVTRYQQTIIPGDAVTFNDNGSGTVILNGNVGPASLTISNNSKAYTFSGNGNIAGPTGVLKLGASTAVLNLTNNSYVGDTVINGGTLQFGVASGMPASANLVIGAAGKLQMAGLSLTTRELTGSGTVDNSAGLETLLIVGGSSGGTWNGTVTNSGGGGIALRKVGTGTWVLGGKNHFDNGQSFSFQNQINQGTVILTNNALLSSDFLQLQIANGGGQTGAVVVAGGTLLVTNNVLSVGYGAASANGTLTVNSGTVDHSGLAAGTFAAVPNSIDVGAQGATGTLIVNGGQVLNDLPLLLGDGATANGTLVLNGGLLRSSAIRPNGTPASSVAYFNGGTLQAATNSTDFISVGTSAMIQSGGLILDDAGFSIAMSSQAFGEDPFSTGGGLLKKGSGTLYLDQVNTYTGTTVITNGTLAGIGSVASPVVIAPAGNLATGDAGGGLASFTINNSLTLQGTVSVRIDKTANTPISDQFLNITTVNYGGTLVVTNTTSDATPLVAGDTFTLINATTHNGNFNGIVGSPGPGLAYSITNGVLHVVGVNSTPTTITAVAVGGTLTLTWPADHTGWTLQAQTNSLSVGIANNWIDVANSYTTNSMTFPISPTSPTVFYRLRLQVP
jgi:autotransporter-associated beta strand protein